MTEILGACDNSEYNGNNLLMANNKEEYVLVSGFEIFKFATEYKRMDLISIVGDNMVLYPIALGEVNTFFYTRKRRRKFIKKLRR